MRITAPPWELIRATGYKGNYEITAAIDTEHEGNARLITAAPDLLLASRAIFWLMLSWQHERGIIGSVPAMEALGVILASINDDTLALRALRRMADDLPSDKRSVTP